MKAEVFKSIGFAWAFYLASSAFAQPMASRRVNLNENVHLHYIEQGEGDAIVFVHGLMDDYSTWRRQLAAFADSQFRAIAYSRRNNHPNKNPVAQVHSAITEAEDLAELIRILKLGEVHVVGHSYGAYTALIAAIRHPDLFKTVVLSEPPLVPWLTQLPEDDLKKGQERLERLMNRGIEPATLAFASGDENTAIESMVDCIGGDGLYGRLPGFVKAKFARNVNELKAFIKSNDRYPAIDPEDVGSITTPTLILSGSESLATASSPIHCF